MAKKESNLPVRIVCATRSSRENFLTHTLTGKSIKSFIYTSKVEVRLFPENKIGLGEVYNKAIEEARTSPAILVFMHDDAVIGDYFWADRIRAAIKEYEIIGVAGNIHRSPRQSSWCFLDDKWTWDDVKNLSGCIGHGDLTHERWTPQLGVLLMLHKPAGLRNEASNAFADGCKTLLDNQINWL